MHEISLIFDIIQGPYYLFLLLQLLFFITSRARLGFSIFLKFSVWVNHSFPS